MAQTKQDRATGKVVRVIGPVVDVGFPSEEDLPEINTALELERTLDGETTTIVCEVAQHIGNSTVRAIAMKPTDGLIRGAPVTNTGHSITVPVGQLVIYVVIAGIFGVLAAVWPARRAARLDVLQAIATE